MQNIGDRYRNVIGIFMNQIMQDQPLTIFGDGEQTRAFSYIKDISPIIANSVNHPEAYNQIFNIGADIPYTVNQLVDVVARAMGVSNIKTNYLNARKEVVHAFADHRKVRKFFGDNTNYRLDEGIKAMADWAKNVKGRESNIFSSIEVKKNMPHSWLDVLRADTK